MDDIYTDFARKTTGWATNCSVSGGFSSTQVQQYETAVKQAETCGWGLGLLIDGWPPFSLYTWKLSFRNLTLPKTSIGKESPKPQF